MVPNRRAASAFAFLCDKVDPSTEVLLDVLLLDFDFNAENTVLLFLLNDFSFVEHMNLISSTDQKNTSDAFEFMKHTFSRYIRESEEFITFLQRQHTEETSKELASLLFQLSN
jgi:hypothetical protein